MAKDKSWPQWEQMTSDERMQLVQDTAKLAYQIDDFIASKDVHYMEGLFAVCWILAAQAQGRDLSREQLLAIVTEQVDMYQSIYAKLACIPGLGALFRKRSAQPAQA